jgi:hypothetical protein
VVTIFKPFDEVVKIFASEHVQSWLGHTLNEIKRRKVELLNEPIDQKAFFKPDIKKEKKEIENIQHLLDNTIPRSDFTAADVETVLDIFDIELTKDIVGNVKLRGYTTMFNWLADSMPELLVEIVLYNASKSIPTEIQIIPDSMG